MVDAGGDTGRRGRGAGTQAGQHRRGAQHVTCTRPSDKHKQTSGKEKPKSRQVRGPRVSSGSLEEPDVSPASAEQRDSSSVNRLQPQADLRGESPIPNGHLHTQTHEGQAASSRREPLQRGRQGGARGPAPTGRQATPGLQLQRARGDERPPTSPSATGTAGRGISVRWGHPRTPLELPYSTGTPGRSGL